MVSEYLREVQRGVDLLAIQPDVVFLGQSVKYQGHAISRTLKTVPDNLKLELPVFEETQMGMSIGLALAGFLPVSVYPRMNFLLLAMNQLVNHLDKIPQMSRGEWKPKVIIKTLVGADHPLDPGPQHKGNFADQVQGMLDWVRVEVLYHPDEVYQGYERALRRVQSTVLVEFGDKYQ